MPELNADTLETLAERLALGFYGLMSLALIVLLFGSTGWAFLLLVAGGCAHVGRASIEEFLLQQRGRDRRGVKLRG